MLRYATPTRRRQTEIQALSKAQTQSNFFSRSPHPSTGGRMPVSSPPLPFLFLSVALTLSTVLRASPLTDLQGVDPDHPVLDIAPFSLYGHLSTGSKDVLLCKRVKVSGHSRLKLGSYANSFRVTLAPSVVIPERQHSKIQVCFHRNASLGLCQCETDEWKTLQMGLWSSVMSPYDERYIDIKFTGEVSGSVSVVIEEDFQQWRLLCLAVGFVLLLLAPIVSSWVPFYYSSSMAIGVFLVIIILLFQGMKLLPTARKNVFYFAIYGSVFGAGSFLLHQFSMLVNAILVNFGLSEEMHNPVAIFALVGIILAGAALGYWIVKKFIISKDGNVDAGVSQFVKWAMRIIATTFILQGTLDTPLAIGSLISCSIISFLITLTRRRRQLRQSYAKEKSPWQQRSKQLTSRHGHAEFLSRPLKMSPRSDIWNSSRNSPAWYNSPVKGVVSPSVGKGTVGSQDYYSTFHKTRKRKKFTKEDWEDFTRESTREAVAGLVTSPEFTDWIFEHADRIQIHPDESSDEAEGSESDSIDEITVQDSSRFSIFNW